VGLDERVHDEPRLEQARSRAGRDTYARAEQAFGHEGLVDMVLLIGLYSSACALINAFEVSGPR
jgi:hypothetical protein